jgi:phosphoglycolate phosphatase-like HAD superfamily hydrolase
VTVRKINQTGTATPSEIRAMAQEANYIFQPELAEDPRRAAYLPGTQIEIIVPAERGRNIRHAIFDHDGTISVLRQGWEDVMETMMVKAIMGERYRNADEASYRACLARVRTYIDQTTGIQTWTQMAGLQSLVREFKMVPEAGIRSPAEYKAIYCSALLEAMKSRTAQLASGELAVDDFVIKNAVAMLQKLSDRGVTLYLASGTDAGDVVREAGVLGYAHLFKGGIFGATDDPSLEAKRMVLERIMREVGDAGALAVFGDGPVEMREARKKGALAVGVASDEVRRHGLNLRKRERLVKAGAHLIVPDFSQIDALLDALNLKA